MKRLKITMIFFMLAGLLLTACNNSSPSSNESGSPSASSGATDKTAEGGKEQKDVTLVVWVGGMNSSEEIEADKEKKEKEGKKIEGQVAATYNLIAAFEKEHPGVKLKFENHGWGEELTQNVQRAVLGGTAPDVVVGESQVGDFTRLGAFKALNIDDMKDDIISGTFKAATKDGEVYGLPLKSGTFALQYNRDVLRKAGYDPDKDIPTTWDELLKMSEEITKKGNGEYYGFMIEPSPGTGSMFRFHPWLQQLGSDFGTSEGDVLFNTPEALKVYEFQRNLSLTSPPGAAAMTDEGQILSALHSGKVAFQIDGPWQIDWAKGDKCDCGYARMPVPEAGKTGNSIIGNPIYSVLRDSKNPDLAEAFVKFIASPEGQAIQMREMAILPVNKKAIDLVPDYFTRYPEMKAFYDELEQSVNLSPLPEFKKNSSQIIDIWTILKTLVFDPKQDIKKAADQSQKDAEDQLK
ncbi:extracellular solute-binding protein [Paenibacillus sp. GCM10027626]|uniref:extracellular solute-binding protein n=1 Tax=Paenibacillus sp. GCM10027626 TaxID=3273411 RepID=UPI003642BA90